MDWSLVFAVGVPALCVFLVWFFAPILKVLWEHFRGNR